MQKKLSLVVPAYNEEKRIGKFLESYLKYFDSQGLEYEIVVVINNTNDRTEEIVRGFKSKKIKILRFKAGGKGFAVKEGFIYSLNENYEYIGFVDADLATPPESFHFLLKCMVKNKSDGAIADRTLKRSVINPKMTFKRKIFSRVFNFYVRSLFLFKYRDTQCGAKIFRREAIRNVCKKIGMTKWAFDVELLYLLDKKRFKIISCRTKWENRDKSKIKLLKDSLRMFFAVLQLRLIKSPLRRILRPLRIFRWIIWGVLK